MSSRLEGPWGSFAGIFIVTNLGLLAIGATLPVLPRFINEELSGSDLEVGLVTGAFAFTGIVCRPIAGNLADRKGRKFAVMKFMVASTRCPKVCTNDIGAASYVRLWTT